MTAGFALSSFEGRVAITQMAVLLLCCSLASSASLSRPDVLHFGYFFSFLEGSPLDGVNLYAGLKVAEHEINSLDELRGTQLSIDFLNASSTTNASIQLQNAVDAIASLNLTGFVMSDYSSTHTLYNASRSASGGPLPIVAGRTLTNDEFTPSHEFAIHLRMPQYSQSIIMLHHAINEETTQCSKFAVIARPMFTYQFDTVKEVLARIGFAATNDSDTSPAMVTTILLDADETIINATSVVDQWYTVEAVGGGGGLRRAVPPLCGLFFTTAADVIAILGALYADPRFNSAASPLFPSMSFYGSSYAASPVWNHSTIGTSIFSRLFLVSSFPDVLGNHALEVRFRSAYANWSAVNNQSNMPSVIVASNILPSISQRTLEGYVAGKLIGNILKTLPVISPSAFIQAAYEGILYYVNDMTLGPYVNHQLDMDDPTDVYPAYCNTGMRSLQLTQVSGTTGKSSVPARARNDPIFGRCFALYTVGHQQCYLTAENVRFPIRYALFSPQGSSSSSVAATALFSIYVKSMRLQAYRVNQANILSRYYFSASWLNNPSGNVLPPPVPGESLSETLSRVHWQLRPTVIVGSWFPSVDVPIVNLYLSASVAYEDDPALNGAGGAVTEWSRYTWTMRLTLADICHGLAMFLQQLYSIHGQRGRSGTHNAMRPRVLVVAEEQRGYELAVLSLHTAQFAVDSGQAVNLSDPTVLANTIERARSLAASGQETILFVSSISGSCVLNVVNAIAAMASSASSSPSSLFDHLVVAIATDQNNVYGVKFQQGGGGSVTLHALQRFPVYFGSFCYPFWELDNDQRAAASNLLNSTNPQLLESLPIHAGMVVATLVTQTVQQAVSPAGPADIMDVLYRNQVTTVNGVILGPVYDANCSSSISSSNSIKRQCQCFKALRTINVYDMRDWLNNTAVYNPNYAFSLPGCGVEYAPLIESSSLNVALVAGVTVSCGIVSLMGLVFFVLCCGKRSNRAAPKDASQPFCMVFTDVQSSTALWSRAPEIMSIALEQHHDCLRRLIAKHDGYEVKTIGDSFMVAFKHAKDGASFALDIQTVLYDAAWPEGIDEVYLELAHEAREGQQEGIFDPKQQTPNTDSDVVTETLAPEQSLEQLNYPLSWNGIRVRVGLHWGVGSIQFDPVSQGFDYYGTVVNTAARVEGVGNGGQVLVTKEFYDELENEGFSFEDVDVKPLGAQPLRGLDQPIPLYQLSPMKLRSRQFNALRLDRDNDVEESSTAQSDGQSSSATRVETPDEYLNRLLLHQKDQASLRTIVVRSVEFMDSLLRVTSATWRKDVMKTLLKKWHVSPPHKSDAAFDVIALAVRVCLSAEEARRYTTAAASTSGERGGGGGDVSSVNSAKSSGNQSNNNKNRSPQSYAPLLVPKRSFKGFQGTAGRLSLDLTTTTTMPTAH